MDNKTVVERYGPWALVLGASEGLGSAFVETLAAHGLNIVLVSRRQQQLDEVAAGVRAISGVETRTLAIDLELPDAVTSIADAVSDIDIGLLVNCAGGDSGHEEFLDRSLDQCESLVQRNCITLLRVCHYFGRKMVELERGGIVITSSGAALAGAPGLATYAGTKAFDLLFAEGLWTELKPKNVDVLCVVLADTDTPSLRRQMVLRGKHKSLNEVPKGATTAEFVAKEALRFLRRGPTRIISQKLRFGSRLMGVVGRNRAVGIMTAAAERAMGG